MSNTEGAKPQHNAKAILTEALDTIKATFWVAGKEFDFALVSVWDDLDKAIEARVDDDVQSYAGTVVHEGNKKVKVTGVCSIGAISIANCTLYDEPIQPWDSIAQWDLETWKAGAALAMTILDEGLYPYSACTDPGEIIASWNDADDKTRDDIIPAFEKALQSPLLASPLPYTIKGENDFDGTVWTGLWFADEAAATAFLGGDSALRKRLEEELDQGNTWTPVPIQHDAIPPTTEESND